MTSRQQTLGHALLWAAAIIAAALVRAPALLTLILLPNLAVAFLLITPASAESRCRSTQS